jgi:uncharacterized protein (TIGR02145 family)
MLSMRLFLSFFALLVVPCVMHVVRAQYSPEWEAEGSGDDEDPCRGSTAVTFDGYTYALVAIGNQCWLKENLRSDNYRNGDAIPGNLTDDAWASTYLGAQAVYKNDPVKLATYGRLYNWFAVNDARGLCPVGFHVPTDGEWTALESAFGGSSVAGTALKSSATDSPPHDGTNSSGFKALIGGARSHDGGAFSDIGDFGGYWWSGSASLGDAWNPDAWTRRLYLFDSSVYRYHSYVRDGLSVRCVRDEGVVCLDPDNDGVCAENEVSGCTSSIAENFNPSATEEDGTCRMPDSGSCDDVATVTFDGYTYNLVAIGNQCWFKENLRSDNYRNGDAIPGNLTDDAWASTDSGAQTVYDKGASAVDRGSNEEANLATYGRLYNWHAVNDSRGLCPVGFHVPSDEEWTVLENVLGGSDVAGTALKSLAADSPRWDGSNSSGFSALLGGYRDSDYGSYDALGIYGLWWSSSQFETDAWDRYLTSGISNVSRSNYHGVRSGFSVRCVRD